MKHPLYLKLRTTTGPSLPENADSRRESVTVNVHD